MRYMRTNLVQVGEKLDKLMYARHAHTEEQREDSRFYRRGIRL